MKARCLFHLDVQAGRLTKGDGGARDLSPTEMMLLYWMALAAPPARMARALTITEEGACRAVEALRRRLGLDDHDVPVMTVANGIGPASAWPWPDRTALTILRHGLARAAGVPVVHVVGEGVLSAGEVRDLVGRIAAGLRRDGVGPGGWVAVDATQRLESYLVAMATLLIGGVVVRLGDSVGPATLRAMVGQAPAVLTVSARFGLIGEAPETGARISLADDDSQGDNEIGFADWVADCPAPPPDLLSQVAVSPDDPALIGFSSGSTGAPKPVRTSHEAVFRTSEAAARRFGFDATDVFCTATDFTALSAFRSMVTLPLLCGGTTVLPSAAGREQPLALALEADSHGVTRLTAVPNVLRGLVKAGNRLPPGALTSLRTVFSGSGILDAATAEAFRARVPVPLVDYYGAREIGTVAYSNPDQPGTLTTQGGLASEALIRMLDEAGQPVAVGDCGEICVHTDGVMLDTLGHADPTVGVRDGWYWTGDLGRVHDSGRIEIIGRRRDIIKTREGGLVSPIEIEDVLNEADVVREACVFGWRDGDGIEKIAAVVVPAEAHAGDDHTVLERALRTRVLDRLGPYKVPSHVLVRPDLPRVGRGKPDKMTLRTAFEADHAGRSARS